MGRLKNKEHQYIHLSMTLQIYTHTAYHCLPPVLCNVWHWIWGLGILHGRLLLGSSQKLRYWRVGEVSWQFSTLVHVSSCFICHSSIMELNLFVLALRGGTPAIQAKKNAILPIGGPGPVLSCSIEHIDSTLELRFIPTFGIASLSTCQFYCRCDLSCISLSNRLEQRVGVGAATPLKGGEELVSALMQGFLVGWFWKKQNASDFFALH